MFSKLFQPSAIIHDADARLLVNLYYDHQNNKQKIQNRLNTADHDGHTNLTLLQEELKSLEKREKDYKKLLTRYVDEHEMGGWFSKVYGVSPILAAGLLSTIDIAKANTVGHIWSYCGLDPNRSSAFDRTVDQQKYNQHLKRITWLIGYSFKTFSDNPNCLYGKLYLSRKQQETENNENKVYAETAKKYLDHSRSSNPQVREVLEQGMLTASHIDARARRWTVKIFISHLHRVWYERHWGKLPPMAFTNKPLSYENFLSDVIPKDDSNTLDNVNANHDEELQ
jgi:hypothetical protein